MWLKHTQKMTTHQWRATMFRQAINKLKSFNKCAPHVTIYELVDEVKIGSVHSILSEDFIMQRMSVKFVPELLKMKQNQLLEVSKDMMDCENGDHNFLSIVITSDESWVYRWRHSSSLTAIKNGRCAATSKSRWQFPLTLTIFHKTNSTKEIIWECCDAVSCKSLDLWIPELGNSIMAIHLPILNRWFRVLWPNTKSFWFIRLPTLLTWLWNFWPYCRLKMLLLGTQFEIREKS